MNTGDFIFFEFELSQIEEMKNKRITQVSTGHIQCSGQDLSYACRPLSMDIKVISDNFEYYSDKFHQSKFSHILNYPDIHRKLVEMWTLACDTKNDDDLTKSLDDLRSFYNKTIEMCEETRASCVNGVRVIGR
jgi:hypothetical protein